MKIAVISGSMRGGSQSLKVSNWLKEHLTTKLNIKAEVLDLHAINLPMYTTEQESTEETSQFLKNLESSDAFVFVSPEWNGMMSHGIINMQHYMSKELANKPVMLVGVSAGRGGSYPVLQMRTMGHKNNQYVISSENLVLQGVNDLLNDQDMDEGAADYAIKKRADYALRVLNEYAKALKHVRDSGVIDFENFENGM